MVLLLLVLMPVRAPAQGTRPRYTVLRSHNGFVVLWNESYAHFRLALEGAEFTPVKKAATTGRGETTLDGLALKVDGKVVQILTVSPSLFSSTAEAPDVLARHRQWEIEHWTTMVGEAVESEVLESGEAVPPRRGLFWEIEWPDSAAQRHGSQSSKAIFYTFVAGDLLVSLSVTVMKGDSELDVIRFMESAARSIEIKQEPFDVDEVQRQLRTVRKPNALANFAVAAHGAKPFGWKR